MSYSTEKGVYKIYNVANISKLIFDHLALFARKGCV